jgi:predicted dienelactone hydrolase
MNRLFTFLGLTFLLLSVHSAAAQRPDAPPFGERGPYAVGTRELRLDDDARPLKITVWYPAQNPDDLNEPHTYRDGLLTAQGHALPDAAPDFSDAPYPLVIFSHGNAGTRLQSIYFVEHLASRGFVVMAADHLGNTLEERLGDEDAFADGFILNISERPRDVTRLIDLAESEVDLADFINTDRVAVTGHSLGGFTALASAGGQMNFSSLDDWCEDIAQTMEQGVCFMQGYAEDIAEGFGVDEVPSGPLPPIQDARVSAVVLMAPWNAPIFDPGSLAAMDVPAMVLVGSLDETATPSRDAFVFYEYLGGEPRALVTFQNANHFIFVDVCSEFTVVMGLHGLCSDAVWDLPRAHDLTNHFASAFLRAIFYDDAAAWEALDAAHVSFPGVDYQVTGE